jgi:hypothetical protein
VRRVGLLLTATIAAAAVALPVALVRAQDGNSAAAQKPAPLCFGKRATIVGTPRSEGMSGTRRTDVIVGLGGSDRIVARGGNDLVCGGAGNDQLQGQEGSDRLDGGPGSDTCRGGERAVRCEETRPALPRSGPLQAGPYVVEAFRPRLGFVVGAGWSVRFPPAASHVLIAQRRDPGGTSLAFDSRSSAQSVAATISRLAGIAGVDADAPSAVAVGGAAGQRVDLRVTSSDVVLVPGLTDRYELEPNDRVRLYAVGVGGRTVTILVEAPTAEFETFVAVAQGVLESVRWG